MYSWKDKKFDSSLSRAKFFRNLFAYFTLFAALGAMVFFGVCSPDQSGYQGGPMGSAAKVAGEEISRYEFRRAYENAQDQYRRIYGEAFDPAALTLAKNVLNNLVDQRVAYHEAKRLGMAVPDSEIERQILDIFKDESGKFSAERFKNALQYYGYTEASFMEELRREMMINNFRRFIGDTFYVSSDAAFWDFKLKETKMDVEYIKIDDNQIEVSVSDQEIQKFLADKGKDKVKEYYEKNKNEFNKPKKVRARHILISYDGAKRAPKEIGKRSKEEAKKIAEAILKEAQASGDFAKLASAKTDEASGKTKGGDLGFFAKEDMAKEFSDAAFAMQVGEVSKAVVESPFGFHIIKVEGVQAEVNKSLEAATKEIATKLLEKEKKPDELKRRADEVLAKVKSGDNASDLLKRYGLQWQSTGEFALNAASIPKIGADKGLKDAVFSLRASTKVSPNVVDVGGSKYILRLKNIQLADDKKFDEKNKDDLTRNIAFSYAYQYFNEIKERAQKNLEKDGSIRLNEDYLALDVKQTPEGS